MSYSIETPPRRSYGPDEFQLSSHALVTLHYSLKIANRAYIVLCNLLNIASLPYYLGDSLQLKHLHTSSQVVLPPPLHTYLHGQCLIVVIHWQKINNSSKLKGFFQIKNLFLQTPLLYSQCTETANNCSSCKAGTRFSSFPSTNFSFLMNTH